MKNSIRGSSSLLHFSPGVGGVKLMVSSLDFPTAKIILEEYYKNREDK